ncbi:hypothetical protein D4R71_04620 [bacterium]|nr:MAG: hypothetical protein D4R71_04620 [bacterium]
MKKLLLTIIVLTTLTTILFADYIIPTDDPVYVFLDTAQNLGYTEKLISVYPQYQDEIIKELNHMLSLDIAVSYKKLAEYHLRRLSLNTSKGFESALYPIKKIPRSFLSIFIDRSQKKRLFTYKNNNINLFLSGIIGLDYDLLKSDTEDKHRLLKYYRLEFGGNLSENIGLFSIFRKGHYTGDAYFTRADSVQFISDNWENPEKVEVQTECFLQTNLLDFSIGYGNFQFGNAITSSIILNKDISPFPYIKVSKQFGGFSYISLYSQLVPDSLKNETEYETKSYALQMLSYQTEKLSLSIGECSIYGDRNFDISYSTPLIMYKLVDFANRSRDNVNAFIMASYVPFKGIRVYNNLFIDDVKLSRLKTDKYLSGFAEQLGVSYSFEEIPLNITFEGTAIGPRTYCHRRDLTYSHRDQLLGYPNGSNQLNLAIRAQYLLPGMELKVLYSNMQQGSISNDPFKPQPNTKFLAGEISRTQNIFASINYSFTPELKFHLRYEYENKDDKEKNYLYSGIELKY